MRKKDLIKQMLEIDKQCLKNKLIPFSLEYQIKNRMTRKDLKYHIAKYKEKLKK